MSHNLDKAARRHAKYYNRRHSFITYSPGEMVYVDARYRPKSLRGPLHKFANKREGPFQVTSKLNQISYSVRVPILMRGRYKILHRAAGASSQCAEP